MFNEKPSVILPMTKVTGKVRLKNRNSFCEYGIPFAPTKEEISLRTYVEWQIGYDLLAKGNENETSIKKTFVNYKGEVKLAYELSEIIYHSVQCGLLSNKDIDDLKEKLKSVNEKEFLDTVPITRTNPVETKMNGINFYEMKGHTD